jgi:hypothetical protein
VIFSGKTITIENHKLVTSTPVTTRKIENDKPKCKLISMDS